LCGAGAKILVVEDVELQRKLMVRKLKSADASWDVTTAVSGEDALQKLKVSDACLRGSAVGS